MNEVFLMILQQSVTASYILLIAIFLRLLLKKMPRRPLLLIWAAAGIRLLFPVSLPSPFSLIPPGAEPQFIPKDIVYQAVPEIQSGVALLDDTVNAFLPAATPTASVNPLQIYVAAGTAIWLLGIALITVWSLFSLYRLKQQLKHSDPIEPSVYEKQGLPTAFVLGFIDPKIYLPAGLSSEEKQNILLHEKQHIRQLDPFIKLTAFFISVIHWFNPLVWLGFSLISKDLEISCDEALLKRHGEDLKKSYAASLLSLSSRHPAILPVPLAFSEGNTGQRIRRILSYRRPAAAVTILALIVTFIFSLSLISDPKTNDEILHLGIGAVIQEIVPEDQTFVVELVRQDTVLGRSGDWMTLEILKMKPDSLVLMTGDSSMQYLQFSDFAVGDQIIINVSSRELKMGRQHSITPESVQLAPIEDYPEIQGRSTEPWLVLCWAPAFAG